ncbi:MAG TPA: NAD(P)H-dependent oxidoreductase [Pedobacter sp.]
MTNKIKILAISGSTRKSSSNLNLIHAIADLAAESFEVSIFEGLSELPHFNPDDIDHVSAAVTAFKEQLNAADGILICTPEYAIGVPGTLKNAIDWTVSSMEFSKKPVALITAATSGAISHQSLLGTLLILESRITGDTQLIISAVKSKISANNEITDRVTLNQVEKLIRSLTGIINGTAKEMDFLPAPVLMNGD